MSVAIVSAALPFRRNGDGCEILLIRSTSGRWLIPKGHGEPGEVAFEVAEREAWEEAGVRGEIWTLPYGGFDHLGNEKSQRVLVHPLLVLETASTWPEKSWRQQMWVPATALPGAINPALRRLIADFVAEFCALAT
jgi:8-oxo-dGTP pyrophosphatase MutT (NUDIX family)